MLDTYSADYHYLPEQRISDREKLSKDGTPTAWAKQCVNAIANMAGRSTGFRKTPQQMQVNYDLINGKFDPSDVQHVINPTNNPELEKLGGLPARYQHYDIISAKLNELEGEEIKRPFNFRAYGTSGGVMSRQKEKHKELINLGLQNQLAQALGLPPDPEHVPLEQVEEYFKTKYKDPAEVGANQILKALVPKLKVQMKFNKGFRHVMAAAEEHYWVGIVNGEPAIRTTNPLYCAYDLDPDLDFVEDGQYFREDRFMSTGSVLDEFRSHLLPEDVRRLDRGETSTGTLNYGEQMGYAYNLGTDAQDGFPSSDIRPGTTWYGGIPGGSTNPYGGRSTGRLHKVTKVVWRSLREVGFLRYPEEGKMQETLVDPAVFTLTKQMKALGATLSTQWVTDIWEGTRIDRDIYVDVHPLNNQTGKLPYCGYIYSALNSQATSPVDRVKSLQYLYNVTWFRLENEMAKSKGKQIVIDMAQIPRTGEWGMSMDQWLYYRDTLGLILIDTTQEGAEGDPRNRSNFNQWQSLDQAMSANVGVYLNILEQLKTMVGDIIGVSRQREGNITSNETVGGVERAVNQSSNITEPLFYYHNLVKQNVLTQLVQVAKLCYLDGIHGQYVIDDVTREWLNIDGGLLNDSEYSVFIRDSSADAAVIQKLQQLAEASLQQGAAKLSDIVSILDSQSVSEMKAMLLTSEDNMLKERQEQGQQQQAMQQEQLAAQAQEQDAARQFTAEQAELDRDNDIRKAYIAATKGAMGDGDGNGISDGLDMLKATTDQNKAYSQHLKLQADTAQKQRAQLAKEQSDAQTLALKQQEMGIKVQQAASNHALAQQKLELEANKTALSHAQFVAEQTANKREQDQQDRVHADKQKMDKELLKLKNQEVKAKIKQLNKPKPKGK